MTQDSTKKYLSLQEATKLCGYSQEYLSLRARQRKLKAAKFGRNWVTTKEWLIDYLKRVESYNEDLKIKKSLFPELTSALLKLERWQKPALALATVSILLVSSVTMMTDFDDVLASQAENLARLGLAAVDASAASLSEYGSWLNKNLSSQMATGVKTIGNSLTKIKSDYSDANDWLEEKIIVLAEFFDKNLPRLAFDFKVDLPKIDLPQVYLPKISLPAFKTIGYARDQANGFYWRANNLIEEKILELFSGAGQGFVSARSWFSGFRQKPIVVKEPAPDQRLIDLEKEIIAIKEKGDRKSVV